LYHGAALRGDSESNRREQAIRLAEIHFSLINLGGEKLGPTLLERLQKEIPGLNPELVSLPLEPHATEAVVAKLARASLIVGPWPIAVAGGAGGRVDSAIAQAVVASSARKILIPTHFEGWDWAGLDDWDAEAMVLQTTKAVKQFIEGEPIKAIRPMSVGAVIGLIVGGLLLLLLLLIPILIYFSF